VQRVAILGATGSIGRQTLDVIARHPDRLRTWALAAGRDLEGLCALAAQVRPHALALESAADPQAARSALAAASPGAEVWVGPGSAARLAG
jgi:1-deoxy-D-xylulose-5-phosphate reductoisomerase